MPRILFNCELWETGFAHKCRAEGNSLFIDATALYISKGIDSFTNGTVWNRLIISFSDCEDARCSISYFASDHKTVYINAELADIDGVITGDSYNAEEKRTFFKELCENELKNPRDMSLLEAKGRYLWFMLDFGGACGAVYVQKLKIEFGYASWAEYLPEIYRLGECSFLNRFLGMLEGVYRDLDDKIAGISHALDVDSADYERLLWLSRWVASESLRVLPEKSFKALVKNTLYLSQTKGTKQAISKAVELYSGKKPLIVETADAMRYGGGELYGDDCRSFTVIVGESCAEGDPEEFAEGLSVIISYYSPIFAKGKAVVLRPYIVLGFYTYLGINTRLTPKEPLALDGKAASDFGIVV